MQTLRIKRRSKTAFTFLEMVVTVTILGLVIAYGLPVMVKARTDTRLNVIYVNLYEVESAKDRWALDQNKMVGEPVPNLEVLTNYLCWAKFSPVADEAYCPNPVGSMPTAVLSDTTRIGPYGPGHAISLPANSNQVSDSAISSESTQSTQVTDYRQSSQPWNNNN